MTTFNADTNDTQWMQWLDLDADGELSAEERSRLDAAMAEEPARESDRTAFRKLHELLTPGSATVPSVEPSPDFVARVMDNLPVADWEAREEESSFAAWQMPIAAMLLFAVGAAFLLSGVDSAILGTGAAVADFLATTALAGAGLLEASWRGMGWGLQQMFADSPATVAAVAGVVLGVDALFVSMLLRRRRQAVPETVAEGDDR